MNKPENKKLFKRLLLTPHLPEKDLGLMAMAYGYVYVAQIAMGANPMQAIKAIKE